MISDVIQFQSVLSGTCLEGRKFGAIEIDGISATALAIKVRPHEVDEAWTAAFSRLGRMGRYPVVSCSWPGAGDGWLDQVADQFSRFSYKGELTSNRSGDDPTGVLKSAERIDRKAALKRFILARAEPVEEWVDFCIEETERQFGSAPTESEVRSAVEAERISCLEELERWFFRWEMKHFGSQATCISEEHLGYLSWFEPLQESTQLIFMPCSNGWEVPAYLHFFGAESYGSEVVVATLRDWEEKYGARLVAHYGTMLQFVVETPPSDPEDAFELAWEQQALAQCTTALPGVSLRDHARSMLHANRWFLHDRP